MNGDRITREHLTRDFRSLPLSGSPLVAMHSSLSSIGFVEGGAPSVVEALLQALGPAVTLMVPTFTYSFSSIGKWPPFVYESSPSLVGKITEAVRLLPGAMRSFHPTHSVAAVGPKAYELTRAHLASSPLGLGSPFHRLASWGGEVILLGCDHRSNSLLHVAEILAGLPYVDVPFSPGKNYETATIFRDGKAVVDIKIYQAPGCSRGFHKAEPALRRAGVIRDGRVGNAPVQVFPAQELLDIMTAALQEQPDLILCDIPDCSICPRRRQALAGILRR